eukprot:CAMPEP_0114506012 /NCGR_PEP_ID=MMETSP0109-20121206/11182_1 /TAXON_ID=29199 /ORGANISM="Chlorarachnion reptans, Strain CCCM449" /LENGTH=343 /DNA_ID=CAMNT_0001684535 /DNA_START=112 /DNA_END=1143 /DNA_ORIENTATION=+
MEEYWEEIKFLSFPSAFIDLDTDTSQAILEARKPEEKEFDSLKAVEESTALMGLASKINTVKKEKGWDEIFVRLSSRSPKDAAFSESRFGKIYEMEQQFIIEWDRRNKVSTEESPRFNNRLRAMYRASTFCLCVDNGVEAVRLLVESNRIREDLSDFIKNSSKRNNENRFNLIVRKFARFDPEMEFRAFVHKKKLTAITQYNDLCYFPSVHRNFKKISARLMDEYKQKLWEKLPLESCVLDLVLCPKDADNESKTDGRKVYNKYVFDLECLELKVIEINPLAEFAGSGMFAWENPKDKRTLLGLDQKDDTDVEFRYRTKVPSLGWVKTNITKKWMHILDDEDS